MKDEGLIVGKENYLLIILAIKDEFFLWSSINASNSKKRKRKTEANIVVETLAKWKQYNGNAAINGEIIKPQ